MSGPIRIARTHAGALTYAVPLPPERLPPVAPADLLAAWSLARRAAALELWGPPRLLRFDRPDGEATEIAIADADAGCWAEAVDRATACDPARPRAVPAAAGAHRDPGAGPGARPAVRCQPGWDRPAPGAARCRGDLAARCRREVRRSSDKAAIVGRLAARRRRAAPHRMRRTHEPPAALPAPPRGRSIGRPRAARCQGGYSPGCPGPASPPAPAAGATRRSPRSRGPVGDRAAAPGAVPTAPGQVYTAPAPGQAVRDQAAVAAACRRDADRIIVTRDRGQLMREDERDAGSASRPASIPADGDRPAGPDVRTRPAGRGVRPAEYPAAPQR